MCDVKQFGCISSNTHKVKKAKNSTWINFNSSFLIKWPSKVELVSVFFFKHVYESTMKGCVICRKERDTGSSVIDLYLDNA